jgi:hypothetical protein
MEFIKVYEGNLTEIFCISPELYFRRANLRKRGQCNGAFVGGRTCCRFFTAKDKDAVFIGEHAKDHAQRELRMVFWEYIRELMR